MLRRIKKVLLSFTSYIESRKRINQYFNGKMDQFSVFSAIPCDLEIDLKSFYVLIAVFMVSIFLE